jgi:molybdenum cofactor cytidylyltransferase
VIRTIKEAGFSPIVVVTGYGADQVRAMLHDMDVLFVHNEQYAEGMGSSIRKAFSSIYGWDAGMVVMGDMPFVSKQTLREIKEAYVLQGHSLVVPCISEKRGQPVLFSVEYFEQLLKCSGDTGARHILEKNREKIHLLEVKDQSIFWDVDTPENIIVHQERIRHE